LKYQYRDKNYETVSKFVKVMPRTLWPLFSPDTVYIISLSSLGFRAVVRATILHKCSYYFCIYAVHFVQMTETSDDDDDDDADVE